MKCFLSWNLGVPVILMVFALSPLFPDSPMGSGEGYVKRVSGDVVLRQHFWVFRDLPPGVVSQEAYDPESVLARYSRFILQLSVFGGNITYTPSDNTRGVEEFFEFIPAFPVDRPDSAFTLEKIHYEENKISAWASYLIDASNSSYLRFWQLSGPKKYPASGFGSLDKGLEGIFEAYFDGMKQSLRNYARTLTKNKPKEIRAKVCITGVPGLSVNAGRYEAKFEMLMIIDEIIPYSVF